MEYIKEYEVRWSDVDANRHMANSAFINFGANTRMYFLKQMGFGHGFMAKNQVGPVVFYEHMWYFKEVMPGEKLRISFEVKGFSKDGMFFEFHHNFYNKDGQHVAHCELMGGWFSLLTRKLISLDEDMLAMLDSINKAEDFRWLTKEDTRKHAMRPQNLE